MVDQSDLSDSQQIILTTSDRVAGAISFVFASMMIWSITRSAYYRNRMYHRIMLGCAICMIILSCNRMWGPAAVPEGTPGFIGARGTTATCTAQGFLYTLGFVVPSYYVALSILCFLAVSNKFKVEKYQWIEKYIHVGVYIIPLSMGSYLLAVEGYNPSISTCFLGSYPLGCGDESPDGIECERGPSNMAQLSRIFGGMTLGIILLFPPFLLGVTFIRVRLFQGRLGHEIASSVAKQSCLYLLALYWSYFFRFIFLGVNFKADSYIFPLHVLSKTVEGLQAVWISMAYYYFRSDPTDPMTNNNHKIAANGETMNNHNHHHNNDIKEDNSASHQGRPSTTPTELIRHSSAGSTSSSSRHLGLNKPSFSIFDGSVLGFDPNSPWSQYLEDEGEDEDYQQNCGEYDDSAFDL